MNMVMQEVLIKIIGSTLQNMDVPNHKFDENLVIIDETFSHLKSKDWTAKAYESLSKQINMSFQNVFMHLNKMNSNYVHASEPGSSHARGERDEPFIGNLSQIMFSEINKLMKRSWK